MNTIQIHVTLEETNLILAALGELPFSRVHRLIARIQEEASHQLQKSEKQEGNGEPSAPNPSARS
jgi:hypothetical protein